MCREDVGAFGFAAMADPLPGDVHAAAVGVVHAGQAGQQR
jgi:hypothetical protein